MPFDRQFDDIYQLGIKAACDSAGAYAERVDEQIFHDSILERVYNQIAKADCIVADMSGRNPNVFYEVGYAHALGKPVLLLTQHADDIPFDLKHYPHIVYEGRIADLSRELERRIRFTIKEGASTALAGNSLVVQINDAVLASGTAVEFGVLSRVGFAIPIAVHNSMDREIRSVACQVGLITSPPFDSAKMRSDLAAEMVTLSTVTLSDGRYLHYLSETFQLLPGGWQKVRFTLSTGNVALNNADEFEFCVRLFTANGYFDYPFVGRIRI